MALFAYETTSISSSESEFESSAPAPETPDHEASDTSSLSSSSSLSDRKSSAVVAVADARFAETWDGDRGLNRASKCLLSMAWASSSDADSDDDDDGVRSSFSPGCCGGWRVFRLPRTVLVVDVFIAGIIVPSGEFFAGLSA